MIEYYRSLNKEIVLELKLGHTRDITKEYAVDNGILQIEKIIVYYTNYNDYLNNLGVENPVEAYNALPIDENSKIAAEISIDDFIKDDYACTATTNCCNSVKYDFNSSIDVTVDWEYLQEKAEISTFI